MTEEYKIVTEDEFDDFIKNRYESTGKKLRSNTIRFCEPPVTHFLDESIISEYKAESMDRYFDTVVCKILREWLGKDGKRDTDNTGIYWEYSIRISELTNTLNKGNE